METGDKIIDFVKKKYNESGQFLAVATERKLKSKSYHVEREAPFKDDDAGKGRYIDLKAEINLPSIEKQTDKVKYVGRLMLTIECKNLPDHVWSLFNEKVSIDKLVFEDKASLDDSLNESVFSKPPLNKYTPSWPLKDVFYASSYDEYILDNGENQTPKSNNRDKNLYDSIMKVTKSTQFELENARYLLNELYPKVGLVGRELVIPIFYIIQPVIVFRGHLFGHTLGNDPEFARIKCAQMPKKYISKNYNVRNGLIHIVEDDYFEEYLDILSKHYNIFSQKLISDQSLLEDDIIPKIMKFLQSYNPLKF